MAFDVVIFLADLDSESLDLLLSEHKENVAVHIDLLDFAVHDLLG